MGFRVREYITREGKCPFRNWLESLPISIKARIQARIFRFELGNLGDYKSVGGGVLEARLVFGPGYRVYFGIHKREIVVLLLGGDKDSQKRDIVKAKLYWSDFLEYEKHGTTK